MNIIIKTVILYPKAVTIMIAITRFCLNSSPHPGLKLLFLSENIHIVIVIYMSNKILQFFSLLHGHVYPTPIIHDYKES